MPACSALPVSGAFPSLGRSVFNPRNRLLSPRYFDDPDAVVDAIIAQLGPRIVLGLPLGLGKANHIANALVERALNDATLSLTILTALTLEAPQPRSLLEQRMLGPINERLFAGYPPLRYAALARQGKLPANIEVREFFLQPGKWNGVARVQQQYMAVNYTQAVEALLAAGMNVAAQLIAVPDNGDRDRISLSCNPDLTVDLLEARRRGDATFLAVGQVNRALPFMVGSAERAASDFDLILDSESTQFPLFTPPRESVSLTDYAIGLRIAALIPDGGSLQIGIGSIGDAVVHALLLRHRDNARFRAALAALGVDSAPHCEPFVEGLYGISEMLVDGFLELLKAGILRREVDGRVLHAGFFVGSPGFYENLAGLSPEQRNKIGMEPISFVNQLYGDEQARRRARVGARFVNSAMMATLMGAAVSDGLEDGTVISGVGGQHDFVTQGLALEGARSIISLRAVRRQGAALNSNIRWSYGHVTIPRYLRDMVVTEYGVADLRYRSDHEVVAAMISIADTRFQPALLEQAQAAGKLPADYRIPDSVRNNLPGAIAEKLVPFRAAGTLPAYPFGSDFTAVEQQLLPALAALARASGGRRLRWFWRGLTTRGNALPPETRQRLEQALARMGLDKPGDWREYLYRYLLTGALIQA